MATTLQSALFLLLVAAATAAVAADEFCHPEDKKILLGIKKFYNHPNSLSSWSASTDCCTDWSADLLGCDENTNRITVLNLDAANLHGVIDPAIADLPYLQFLTLTNLPDITGHIPSTFAKIENLKYLWISNTSVTGPIPGYLNTFKYLFNINLSFNKLTGSIPPSLPLAPSIYLLRLNNNHLTGTIPATFRSAKLYWLYLSHNQLTGPIPRSLGKVNYTELSLAHNQLTGDASFLFGKSKPLYIVDLSRNLLSFDMSKVEVPSGIASLRLEHNQIYGSLPASLAKPQDMTSFNVSYNRLCGKIPTGGRLGDFDKYSYIHNKCLCGTPLPACKSSD